MRERKEIQQDPAFLVPDFPHPPLFIMVRCMRGPEGDPGFLMILHRAGRKKVPKKSGAPRASIRKAGAFYIRMQSHLFENGKYGGTIFKGLKWPPPHLSTLFRGSQNKLAVFY